MNKIDKILNKQVAVGEVLMQRVSSLPQGVRSLVASGVVNYSKDLTQPLADDADAWETETLVYLRSIYGDASTPVINFEKNVSVKNHYSDFKRCLCSDLNKNVALLKALIQTDAMRMEDTTQMKVDDKKTPMVFISHSSKDIEFVEALVTLLESMGFNNKTLFCSSIPDYWIGLSKDIFASLRQLFTDHELFVIFVQSPRYYESPVSLNEMGAAWVLQNDYFSILTKDMKKEKMCGVFDDHTVFLKVDAPQVEARMNELKNTLTNIFSLPVMSDTTWERKRNAFLKSVTSIQYPSDATLEDAVKRVELAPEEIDVLKQWVESDDPYSIQQNFMGNRTVYYIGRQGFEVTKAEDKAGWEDFFERLISLGFIILYKTDKSGKPQYKLKKAAYDYIRSLK